MSEEKPNKGYFKGADGQFIEIVDKKARDELDKRADYIVKMDTVTATTTKDNVTTTADWTYRKWNSGLVECWGVFNSGTLVTTQLSSGIYVSDDKVAPFPEDLFVSTPQYINIQAGSGTGTAFGLWVRSLCSKDNLVYRIARGDSGKGSITCNAFCIGKWK